MAISGEWWLIDGTAHFADGDVGDLNHEAYVWQHLLVEFVDASESIAELADLRAQISSWPEDNAGDPTWFRTLLLDHYDQLFKAGKCSEAAYDDSYQHVQQLLNWPADQWAVLLDNEDFEARLWACQKLGWARVAGNDVECCGLTDAKLRSICRGLADIQEELEHEKISIEDRDRGKFWRDVPFLTLEAGRVAALRDYL